MNIKKGDNVKVITGKDRDKTGTVLRVLPDANRLVVEGINMFKKRSKPKKQGEKGETVLVPRSMNASNVMLVCKNCKKATRIGHRIEGKTKVRFCKKCSATI